MESLNLLYQERRRAVTAARAILDAADSNGGRLSGEDRLAYARWDAEIDRLSGKIESKESDRRRRERQAELEAMLSAPANAPLVLSFGASGRFALAPGDLAHERAQANYRESFLKYVQGVSDRTPTASLGLQVSSDPKGGYLAPTTFVARLLSFLSANVFMRQIATVLPPMAAAASIDIPSLEVDFGDGDWTAEVPASDLAEDDNSSWGKRELCPHLLSKFIKCSYNLWRAKLLDPERILAERLGMKLARTEEKAFLVGTGAQQPLGVFTPSDDGVPTSQDFTTAGAGAITADDVMGCFYALGERYQDRATWVVSGAFLKKVRELKDSQGGYLWQPGLGSDDADTICDRPYRRSEFAPNTLGSGTYAAVVGDFQTGYLIADALELEIQVLKEKLALRSQVGLVARQEVDGQPVVGECFSRLKVQ